MTGGQTFALQSLPGSAWAVGIGVALVLGVIATLFIRMVVGLKGMWVEILPDAVSIHAPFYGRRVPKSALKLDQAKVLASEAELRDRKLGRSNGVGLPGYKVGWFTNKSSGEKGLLFVTDKQKILNVPTREGYSLYLSADDPAELLTALKGR